MAKSLEDQLPKQKPNVGKPKKLTCSSCRHEQVVSRWEMRHASRPRCEKCGGPLNYEHQA